VPLIRALWRIDRSGFCRQLKGYTMKYDRTVKQHEDSLKVELSNQCSRSGIRLHVEYRHKNCRFDAVVVRNNEILAIIEIKRWTRAQAKFRTQKITPQLKKYSQFDVPVYVLWCFEGIKPLTKRLSNVCRRWDKKRKMYNLGVEFFPWVKITKQTELDMLIKEQETDDKYNGKDFRYR
jgi:hypothetical protein